MITHITKGTTMEYRGSQNDTKPLNVANGSVFIEIESGAKYLYDAENSLWVQWNETGISDEQIQDAVDNYLEEHPVSGEDLVAREGISQLSESIADISNMVTTKFLDGNFENGSLNTDGVPYSSGYNYRVRSGGFEETLNVAINIKSGFQIYVHYYADTSGTVSSHKSSSGGWKTGSYTILTNYPYYKIVVKRASEKTSEVANVIEFASSLTVGSDSVLITTVKKNSKLIEDVAINLPDYWENYLANKVSSISSSIASLGNHGDSFAFFTDYHAPQNAKHTANILKYIKSKCDIKNYVFGGDVLTNHTKEEAISILNDFRSDFDDLDILSLTGNHEYNRYSSSSDYYLKDSEWYQFLHGDNECRENLSMENGAYYYVDNKTQKIRYIFLNTNYSFTQFSVAKKQIEWFIDTLNTVSDGWSVVVLTHWYYGTVNSDYSLSIDGTGTIIKTICDGYATKTVGTVAGVEAAYNVPYDFTNAKGTIVCIVCGHTHNDFSETSNGYHIIATMCDAYQSSSQNPSVARTFGTIAEQAIDLFFIDTKNKKIKTIRIGAGSDREFSY